MSRHAPPTVDDGDTGSVLDVVRAAWAPSWARLHATLLVLAPMLAVLLIWETFRLPDTAIATFLLLMIVRGDAVSTIGNSFITAATVSIGALIAIVVLAMSLSQPALRIPLMAAMTFTTMMLVRGTTVGPVIFLVGFFATYGTTMADNMMGLAQSQADVTNTEGTGLPDIAFFPPEEALLHGLLWLSVVATVPALLLAVAERIAGADPRRLLLARLRARAEAAAAFCRGDPGATDRLRTLGREGIAPLADLAAAAERAHRTAALHDAHLRFCRALNRLVLLLAAWGMARPDAPGGADEAPFLGPVGAFARTLGHRLRAPGTADTPLPPAPPLGTEDTLGGALPLLAAEIRAVLEGLRAADAERARATRPGPATRPARKPFWQPDAFGAPNIRFALKVTLSVMTAYVIENGLDWSGISTAVITCFFVALGTIGESVHKMTMRIVGCLVGAALGIGTILLLMPWLTDVGQLVLVFAPVAFVSTWIGFGSPRIAYAGWQMLLAFGLTTLQGYGPTLDMQTARDRVIGILLGNLIVTLVFLFIWPVGVNDAVRRDAAGAFDLLGRLMGLGGDAEARRASENRLRDDFVAAVTRIGGVIPNDRYEPARAPAAGTGHLDRRALAHLARLIVPVSAIATDDAGTAQIAPSPPPGDDLRVYHAAMQAWFARAATWIRTGDHQDELRATLPAPPSLDGIPPALGRLRGRIALYVLLRRQIGEFLDDVLPVDASRTSVQADRSSLVAAG